MLINFEIGYFYVKIKTIVRIMAAHDYNDMQCMKVVGSAREGTGRVV